MHEPGVAPAPHEAPAVNLPHVQLVRQTAPQPTVADVPNAVRRAWLESTHGRKILRAIELRQAGSQIAIVAEEPWILSLDRGTEAAAS